MKKRYKILTKLILCGLFFSSGIHSMAYANESHQKNENEDFVDGGQLCTDVNGDKSIEQILVGDTKYHIEGTSAINEPLYALHGNNSKEVTIDVQGNKMKISSETYLRYNDDGVVKGVSGGGILASKHGVVEIKNSASKKADLVIENNDRNADVSVGHRSSSISAIQGIVDISGVNNLSITNTVIDRGMDNIGILAGDNKDPLLNYSADDKPFVSNVSVSLSGDLTMQIISTNESKSVSKGIMATTGYIDDDDVEHYTRDTALVDISSKNNNIAISSKTTNIQGDIAGIDSSGKNSNVKLTATAQSNEITVSGGGSVGIESLYHGKINLEANVSNIIKADDIGIYVNARNKDIDNKDIVLTAQSNQIEGSQGIYSMRNGNIELNANKGKSIFSNDEYIANNIVKGELYAVFSDENSQVNINADDLNYITANRKLTIDSTGYFELPAKALNAMNGSSITVDGKKGNYFDGYISVSSDVNSIIKVNSDGANYFNAVENGIYTTEDSAINISSTNSDNIIYSQDESSSEKTDNCVNIGVLLDKTFSLDDFATEKLTDIADKNIILSGKNNIIYANTGIKVEKSGSVDFSAKNSNNIYAQDTGIDTTILANIDIVADEGDNNIIVNKDGLLSGIGINVTKINDIDDDMPYATNEVEDSLYNVSLSGKNNNIEANTGVYIADNGKVNITAINNNTIIGNDYGVKIVSDEQEADLKDMVLNRTTYDSPIQSNLSISGNINFIEGKTGIYNEHSNFIVTASSDDLFNTNIIKSETDGIWAKNSNNSFVAEGGVNSISTLSGNSINSDNSNVSLIAQINMISAGEIFNDEYYDGTAVRAVNGSVVDILGSEMNYIGGTLYADEEEAVINVGKKDSVSGDIIGGTNYITSSAYGLNKTANENVVSAIYSEEASTINIYADDEHFNYISTIVNLEKNPEGKERVVWAKQGDINIEGRTYIHASNGSIYAPSSVGIAIAAGVDEDLENANSDTLGVANINLAQGSEVFGDIVAGKNGVVNFTSDNLLNKNEQNLTMQGNILAVNGGEISVDIGDNSTYTGRIDAYLDSQDAPEHGENFFTPEFDSEITSSGIVNFTLGKNSRWNVSGQSWVSKITSTDDSAIIDLTREKIADMQVDEPSSITIGELDGNINFKLYLNGEEKYNSDMLYIGKANGNINIAIDNVITNQEIGENGFRFATIGRGSEVNINNVVSMDKGILNVVYKVGTDQYLNSEENDKYNGENFNESKPGNQVVDDFFEGEPNILTEQKSENNNGADSNNNEDNILNYKIIGISKTNISNAGKTVINMSKSNYSEAVYLDNLNKRLGEARFLENDDGLWIRMRHDKIDKDNSFTVNNNMYELGYDTKEITDTGVYRRGIALDYMQGSTSYADIMGSGKIKRQGVWLYDTWLGNKGHYVDYVLKWGHLANDFNIFSGEENITGQYSNNVYSMGAEYGYKHDLGNSWYFEPQAQLQYARVTGADYNTNQNSEVFVDGINSLIGRVGFRLGKDFDGKNKSTVYLKADMIHEFLGEQNISVRDKTTDNSLLSMQYDHSGTWYDIGLGVNMMMNDNSYVFIDFERSFGDDNANSYQVSGGINWLF